MARMCRCVRPQVAHFLRLIDNVGKGKAVLQGGTRHHAAVSYGHDGDGRDFWKVKAADHATGSAMRLATKSAMVWDRGAVS
jgi:hypothetical protein